MALSPHARSRRRRSNGSFTYCLVLSLSLVISLLLSLKHLQTNNEHKYTHSQRSTRTHENKPSFFFTAWCRVHCLPLLSSLLVYSRRHFYPFFLYSYLFSLLPFPSSFLLCRIICIPFALWARSVTSSFIPFLREMFPTFSCIKRLRAWQTRDAIDCSVLSSQSVPLSLSLERTSPRHNAHAQKHSILNNFHCNCCEKFPSYPIECIFKRNIKLPYNVQSWLLKEILFSLNTSVP